MAPDPSLIPRWGTLRPRALVALALLVSGCSAPNTRAYNLRELHRADGGPRLSGALMSEFEFAMRTTLQQGGESGIHVAQKPPVRIDDPHGECFENLRELADADSSPGLRSIQVEFFAWLGVDDRYVLSRECAVRALGPLARSLGVTRRARPPYALDSLSPDEVVALTTRIVRGASAAIRTTGDVQAQADLEAAVDELLVAPLDRDGARRVLALIAILSNRAVETPAEGPLIRLESRLHEDLVAWALTLALEDDHGLVRAAAVDATRGFDPGERDEILFNAIRDPFDPEVTIAGLRNLAAEGIPEADPPVRTRTQWLETLLDISQYINGPESLAACDALSAVSGAGFQSSRGEDWIVWWMHGGSLEAEAASVGPTP